jgi:hypothetical protein
VRNAAHARDDDWSGNPLVQIRFPAAPIEPRARTLKEFAKFPIARLKNQSPLEVVDGIGVSSGTQGRLRTTDLVSELSLLCIG